MLGAFSHRASRHEHRHGDYVQDQRRENGGPSSDKVRQRADGEQRRQQAQHIGGEDDGDRKRSEPETVLVLVVSRIFDGEKEAKLIALACSEPPKGRARWTLRLFEDKVVELNIVDRASDSTIGRTLKKTFSSPIANSNGSSHRRPTARS
jgi:hypothetical protein